MYRREKNRKGMLLIVGGLLLMMFLLVITVFQGSKTQVRETEETKGPEDTCRFLTIYKSTAGDVSVEARYVEEDDDEKTILKVPEGEMLTLSLQVNSPWKFESVEILDHSLRELVYSINKGTDGIYRINFAMPSSDVMVTFNYSPEESESIAERIVYLWEDESRAEERGTEEKGEKVTESSDMEARETETSSEERTASAFQETEETNAGKPYGLTLHGLSSSHLSAYGGAFDDLDFLKELGEAMKMEDPGSPYSMVTDVYLSPKEYTGEREPGLVYSYLYFNGNPDWKLLSVYSLKEKSYRFLEAEEETEAPQYTEESLDVSSFPAPMGITGSTARSDDSSSGYTCPEETSPVPITESVSVSLNVCGVSEAFLKHVGGQELFYEQIFEYTVSSGLTGEIASAMERFSIDEETGNAEADFSIQGRTEVIHCSFDGKYRTFSFSGL